MRIKSLFYKKMKCELCGGNFKMKKERGTVKYICSSYDNYKSCQRNAVEEDRLVKLINKRYGRELTDDEIREAVTEIIIRSDKLFDIILTDGVPISFHERGIVF